MSTSLNTLLEEIRDVVERNPHLCAELGNVEQLVVRTPRAVFDDLHELARANRVSVNAIIHHLIDVGLEAMGRPTVRDRAPAIAHYLSRTRKSPPAPPADHMTPQRPAPTEISNLQRRLRAPDGR